MNIYGITAVVLLAIGSWGCSLPPDVPYYSITDRAVLAPIILHGRVLNISASTRLNVVYKACVDVLEVIKGDKLFPKQTCFGNFGGDYICLTDVYEGLEYVFFMNSDGTARYKDGVPISAFVASQGLINLVKQGHCKPNLLQAKSCEPPTIIKKNFQPYMRVKEGERARMSCFANGTAPLLFHWSKKDSLGFVRNTFDIYQIDAVSLSDSGDYMCTVRNPAGETKVLVRLYVEPVPCGNFVALKPGQQSEIKSPNYPQPYARDKSCSWRICPSPGQRVKLDFKRFEINRSFGDNIQIYHECDFNRKRGYIKYCSLASPGILVSKCTSYCLNIWFQSMNERLTTRARGFHAIVTSTNEGTRLFDYKSFYCNYDVLLRFIPREVYFSTTTGRVLDIYKSKGPRLGLGQNINIAIRSSAKNIFGCSTEFQANKEYYIGLKVDGSYVLQFAMLTDDENKPQQFDQQLNKLKITKFDCLTPPPSIPPSVSKPAVKPTSIISKPPRTYPPRTYPPRTDPPRTDPPRTDPPRTDPPRPPPVIPTEVPDEYEEIERPSSTGTPHPLDP